MQRTKRIAAASLALLFLSDILFPTVAWALSTGPSQPEVQSFTPASATDMVDLFSGDMSYNIPLLDVEGYPVNLSYRAGIGMDQEASWVGLGWNLNPGVVERNMRGIPDDFKGDEIVRTMNLRPNRTFGLSYGLGLQAFSNDLVQVGYSASPSFNNYDKFAFELGVNLSMRSTKENKPAACAGLGFTSSSNSGLRVQPSFGFDVRQASNGTTTQAGLNFGLDISSRQGLTNMSFGANLAVQENRRPVQAKADNNMKKGGIDGGSGSIGMSTSFPVGAPTYSPQIGIPMKNTSVSFSFTTGSAIQGLHPNMALGAFFSEQKLASKERRTPAYGYLHLDAGQMQDGAQLDLNREKDGPYSGDRPALGVASLTNDLFSVSGQGIGGSYRAYRAEVGHVYDPSNSSTGSGGSAGLDVGAGLMAHGGARVMVNSSSSHSGRWSLASNQAGQRLRYRSLNERPDLERVYFREANEATVDQDPSLWTSMRKDEAARFTLPSMGAFANRLGPDLTVDGNSTSYVLPVTNHRTKREPRGQLFSYLDAATAEHFALEQPYAHAGGIVKPHHMSEVTVMDQQGGRHVYGLPAYNVLQRDVEFNIEGEEPLGDTLVAYTGTHASTDNHSGKDHYYSCTTTPAYAYAFLLTAVLSHDYSDADDVRGPSDGDLGTYVKFEYDRKHEAFPWRTPVFGAMHARFLKGAPSTEQDDHATYVYGTKEVYHLQRIITRNRVAVFHTSEREDALGVLETGSATADARSFQLDSIALFDKTAYLADPENAPAIKKVHFRYTYDLCQNTPNTNGAIPSEKGKLTLARVWFTYGDSRMGVTTPYVFAYNGSNPQYASTAQDRWGNYKPNGAITNADHPYAEQNATGADANAGAWCLTDIRLPSGGTITVGYQADDYAHVQDRRAMRMFPVVGLSHYSTDDPAAPGLPPPPLPSYPFPDPHDDLLPPSLGGLQSLTAGGHGNRVLWFDLPDEVIDMDEEELMEELFAGINELYFRFKVLMWELSEGDHVSGYARMTGNRGMAYGHYFVEIEPITIDEEQGFHTNPIHRAALEYLRVTYPDRIANTTVPNLDDDQTVGGSFLASIAGAVAGFITGFDDFFMGPNAALHGHPQDFGREVFMGESWIRLNDPDHNKKGGGHRVSSIAFADGWAVMETAEDDKTFTYTQQYTYGDTGGSWGVAAFEPMVGADENPFRKPVYYTASRTLSPDDRFYQEEPFGESLFPSPVVGYSKVVVTDEVEEPIRYMQGTGRVVHEFHTAKDFPTIVKRTSLYPARRSNEVNLFSLLGFKKIDHMHASQGFVVETNDMHGKPKSTTAYPEGSDNAVSYVYYHYGAVPYGTAQRVVNTETTIDARGTIDKAEIGRDYEFVADTREFISNGMSGGADVKFELLYAFVAAIPVPLLLPKLSWESTRFRTGVLVKKIHRFGRLQRTEKMENGSIVSTENLAYDALTGQVLVTRTANDFKDPIYNISFPAYWHYDGMGPAYRNMGTTLYGVGVGLNSTFSHPLAQALFTPGDELALFPPGGGTPLRAWVDKVQGNAVTLTRRTVGTVAALTYRMQVVRSGRRNMQGVPMMQLTTLSNPLEGLGGNVYANIVNASAVEFGQEWATDCNCQGGGEGTPPLNKWVLNQRGAWRLSKEHAWLTERTRSVTNANSNIRRDGVYTSFVPFYKVLNGQWSGDPGGWTTTRTVTHYSNNGQELENKDALGLYASVNVGYRGTLVKSVARNARYSEAGFDGFEDAGAAHCADGHFRVSIPENGLVTDQAHTGRRSIRVAHDEEAGMTVTSAICEEEECQLGFTMDPEGTELTVTGTGGEVSTILAEVLAGTVAFTPTPDGLEINADGPWTARITVTGPDCTYSAIVHNPD